MKKCFRKPFLLVMALICAAGMSGCGKKAEMETVDLNFTFANETGKTVTEVNLRAAGTEEWTENLLNADEWKNNYSMDLSLSGSVPKDSKWETRFVYEDGTESIWESIDIVDGKTYEFGENTTKVTVKDSDTTQSNTEDNTQSDADANNESENKTE